MSKGYFPFSLEEQVKAWSHERLRNPALASGSFDPNRPLDLFPPFLGMQPLPPQSEGQALVPFHQGNADPMPYLQRRPFTSETGQSNKFTEDSHHFAAQVKKSPEQFPFSAPKFTLGFSKGLSKGVWESGKGTLLFAGNLLSHPIDTSIQVYGAISTLAKLVHDNEWKMIGEVLSPEIHQLAIQWHSLPSDKRGELAGYALGKHGLDILAPGAIAKIAGRSAKSAKELASVLKNLQKAEGTLALKGAKAPALRLTQLQSRFSIDVLEELHNPVYRSGIAGKKPKLAPSKFTKLEKDSALSLHAESSSIQIHEQASSINSQSALNEKLRALQKAQKKAVRIQKFSDGRIRYYKAERQATSSGPTRGGAYVTEYNPKTGLVRSWLECYDHSGNTVRVHPKMINGKTITGQHYPPTKTEIEAFQKNIQG